MAVRHTDNEKKGTFQLVSPSSSSSSPSISNISSSIPSPSSTHATRRPARPFTHTLTPIPSFRESLSTRSFRIGAAAVVICKETTNSPPMYKLENLESPLKAHNPNCGSSRSPRQRTVKEKKRKENSSETHLSSFHSFHRLSHNVLSRRRFYVSAHIRTSIFNFCVIHQRNDIRTCRRS